MADQESFVNRPEPIAFRIIPLKQRTFIACGVALIFADGSEHQIGISSRTERGCRQVVRRIKRFASLPEQVIAPPPARLSDAGVLPSGPYHLAEMRQLVATLRPVPPRERL